MTEVDLFAAQLSDQLRAARHHQLLICDKTIVNVLAYARLVLAAPAGSQEAAVVEAMAAFCRAWAPTYDAVFYCPDRYQRPGDPFRAKVTELQDSTATAVRDACALVGMPLLDVPTGLDLGQRIAWTTPRIDPLLSSEAG